MDQPNPQRTPWLRKIFRFMAAYALLVAVSLPWFIPPAPKSRFGWFMLLLLAPPAYLLGEWVGSRFSEGWGERTTFQKILKAAAAVLLVLAVVVITVLFTS